MIPFQLIKTHDNVSGENYDICKAILKHQGISFVEYVNMMEALKGGRGMINPRGGFVIATSTGEYVRDYIQLFRNLDKKGLIRL